MTLSLVTLDYYRPISSSFVLSRSEQILRHVLREQITDDEHHRSYYSYYYYHYRKNSYNTKKLENHQLLDATQTNKQTNNIHFNRTPRIPERISSGFCACFRQFKIILQNHCEERMRPRIIKGEGEEGGRGRMERAAQANNSGKMGVHGSV